MPIFHSFKASAWIPGRIQKIKVWDQAPGWISWPGLAGRPSVVAGKTIKRWENHRKTHRKMGNP